MKILVISHMYPSIPNDIFGRFVHEMNIALMKSGVKITVITPTPYSFKFFNKPRWKEYAQRKKEETRDNIKIYYPRFLSLGKFSSYISDRLGYLGVSKLVRELEFDMVFAHTSHLDGRIAEKVSKKYKKPFVVYIHGADIQKKSVKSNIAKKQIKRNLERATKVYVNSNKILNLLKNISNNINAKVLPIGIDGGTSYNKKSNNKFRIISVANLVPEKGLENAIKSIIDLMDSMSIEYTIIGDGPLKNKLMTLSDGKVIFKGRLDNKAVQKEISQSDIFLLPSLNEAFGVVYLESLWQKTPIIGSSGQGVEDIVADKNVGILVDPNSIDDIKRSIQYLYKNSIERKKMGENGHILVKENYLWKDIGSELLSDMKKICNKTQS